MWSKRIGPFHPQSWEAKCLVNPQHRAMPGRANGGRPIRRATQPPRCQLRRYPLRVNADLWLEWESSI
jgi:hypothetical protein